MELWKIVFHSIPFWYLPYFRPKFTFHSIHCNMSQLQFLGGCLTRRPEILVTLQSPAEIVLCVICDIRIYSTRQQVRRFPGGSWPPKDIHWEGPKSKGPPIKMNMIALYHEYQQNNVPVLTDFSCSNSWKLYITALGQDFIIIFTIIRVCLSPSQYIAQFLFV